MRTIALALAGFMLALVAQPAAAQQKVTLRLHHFLPATSHTQVDFLEPWARKVEESSKGRIKVEIYPSMQLGGRAPQLFDQVRDGVVDIVWTLPGYTPGRFPKVEVFELPFVAGTAKATSQAVQAFAEKHLADEFAAVHPILFHVHAAGAFHMNKKPIATLGDLKGLKIRAPTRISNKMLAALGAAPVGMPVPQVPEALSKGVIDGALLPYEVTTALRIHELTDSNTEIAGPRGIYTAVFLLAMNKQRYDGLPDALKAAIDAHSGLETAQWAGAVWEKTEAQARQVAVDAGHAFNRIEGPELLRWQQASQPVIDDWLAEMKGKNIDGAKLLDDARLLVTQHTDGN